jgi:hypothetical protein
MSAGYTFKPKTSKAIHLGKKALDNTQGAIKNG